MSSKPERDNIDSSTPQQRRKNAKIIAIILLVGFGAYAVFVVVENFLFPPPSEGVVLPPPEPVATGLNLTLSECNCVMFRLDDVQDYFEYDEEIAIMEIFRNDNASLTIGIIGNAFGEDVRLVEYLKKSNVTIANHGWDHEDFSTFTRAEQAGLLKKTNDRIDDILHVKSKIFITPYNAMNNDTLLAMLDSGMTTISADFESDPNFMNATDLLHLPQTSGVSDYDDATEGWIAIPTETVLEEIDSDIEDYGFSVVTMHPADYHLVDIETILDALSLEGIRIVSMADIKQ